MSNSVQLNQKRTVCTRCEQPEFRCYCTSVSAIYNQVPVRIFQHIQEAKHPLATARILSLGIKKCDIEKVDQELCFSASPVMANPYLLFPGSDALPIENMQKISEKKPVKTLIVLDGTWSKCKRMLLGSAWLQSLPRISFTSVMPSRNYLRKANQLNSLSTLEAVVLALETLEGSKGKYDSLLQTLDIIVEHQSRHIPKSVLESRYGR